MGRKLASKLEKSLKRYRDKGFIGQWSWAQGKGVESVITYQSSVAILTRSKDPREID